MRVVPLVLMALLLSCTRQYDMPQKSNRAPQDSKPETCDFGQKVFNTTQRAPLPPERRKTPGGSNTTPAAAVILLDFDGHLVSQTSWNVNGDINCLPANMSAEEMTSILNRVAEDYSPFNVTVTTSESVYNSADPYKRMRVVITESWEWYGQAGGTSYLGSFTWGDNTPCFVFCSLLGYDVKKVGEAAAHEAGHTLGLRHQSFYTDCVYNSEYNSGSGSGETSWAPIMGNSYYRNLTTWYNGPNPYGCTALQDDLAVITGVLGYKPDDYGNAFSSAATITSSVNGLLNSNTDVDCFVLKVVDTNSISIIPFNYTTNEGPNLDIQLKVFNKAGALLAAVNDPSLLMATLTLGAGTYYLQVEAVENSYTSRYGLLGQYALSVN